MTEPSPFPSWWTATPETFDVADLYDIVPDEEPEEGWSEWRRRVTWGDPLQFAVTYMSHHLRDQDGRITFADPHIDWSRQAWWWVDPPEGIGTERHAQVAPRDTGKALALDTPVLTVDRGWTTHGDLKVGDRVFDENGQPCNVAAVSPVWEERPCFRLTFSDGQQIVADENHEWFVSDRYRTNPGIQTTKEISGKWLLTQARGYKEVRYGIPACRPLQYPEATLPISPYVLGAWLGDGDSSGGRITVGRDDAVNLVRELGAEGENPVVTAPPSSSALSVQLSKPRPHLCPREHPLVWHDGKWRPCKRCVADFQRKGYGGPDLAPHTNQPLIGRLRAVGLLGNKHIPEQYFNASYEQRLALFQGLMDTDGTIGSRQPTCEFVGTNERLCRGVLRLAITLGIKAVISTGRATINGVDKGPKWRVSFHTDLPVFHLPRKLQRIGPIRSGRTRSIVNVELVEPQATSCIQVDSPSHLYLVGESLIPTHNSTWWYLLLPMWAAAHGHVKFIAAFAHSATQAENHLRTFRGELDTNELLRQDFPKLVARSRRRVTNADGTTVDNESMLVTKSGFAFVARGIDSSNLGMKIGRRRPDLMILDDVEPDEAEYSEALAEKRLRTIIDAVLPMNLRARVVLTGTTTMLGSIVDQLVKSVVAPEEEPAEWIAEENFTCHYYEPILTRDDGTERSTWPVKWPLAYLLNIRHTRSYAKNFLNQPMNQDSGWWRPEDIQYWSLPVYDRNVLLVDGAVTVKKTSDWTGLAVAGLAIKDRAFVIREAIQVRLAGEDLRDKALELIDEYEIDYVLIEANQGGDLWYLVFRDMPVKISTFSNKEPKQYRIRRLLAGYQYAGIARCTKHKTLRIECDDCMRRGAVFHERVLPQLERQALAYPKVTHEDVLDATAGVVEHLLWILLQKLGAAGKTASVQQLRRAG